MDRIRGGHPLPFPNGGPRPVLRFGGLGGPLGALLALVVLVAVVAAAALLVTLYLRRSRFANRFEGRPPVGWRSPEAFEALRILNERFARGEIDAEDYRERRDLLGD